jgi:hypothetical protein
VPARVRTETVPAIKRATRQKAAFCAEASVAGTGVLEVRAEVAKGKAFLSYVLIFRAY